MAAAAVPASACAMSEPASQPQRCTVVGEEMLPADVGGAPELCAAIERAVSERAPGMDYRVEVRVASESRLVATVSVNGRKLPEHVFASTDRELRPGSFERFARAIAEQVADARQ